MAQANDDNGLTENLGVRVTKSDLNRIDTLVDRIPIATRHSIARAALRIGLAVIEKNPAVLIGSGQRRQKK